MKRRVPSRQAVHRALIAHSAHDVVSDWLDSVSARNGGRVQALSEQLRAQGIRDG